ncbi:MAG: four-carbon acid sugar kinase family protein [Planctomycetota bacterium]
MIDESEIRSLQRVTAALPAARVTLPAVGAKVPPADPSESLVVALDDDPTGTQSVHGVDVVTRWDVDTFVAQFQTRDPAFFVLTNSRGMPESDARRIVDEIAHSLRVASGKTGRAFTCISRSDSTLRGHYPAEIEALAERLEMPEAITVLCPFFAAGGRVTVDDIHYVLDGDRMIPAAQTPFAADASFGYRHSNLRRWVIEKTSGRVSDQAIESLSIDDLRGLETASIVEKILSVPAGGVLIINALDPADVETAIIALRAARDAGKRFLYRTAADFVRLAAKIPKQDLLGESEISRGDHPAGLIVVGSHVPKSTEQLERLCDQCPDLQRLELPVHACLDASAQALCDRLTEKINANLAAGRDTLLATSRELVTFSDRDESLAASRRVSAALVKVVRGIETPLRFLVAKGGITSSDLATDAFDVQRARVLGQILPGIPVWRFGPESRQDGLGYIVFPGNVGDTNALLNVYETLRRKTVE